MSDVKVNPAGRTRMLLRQTPCTRTVAKRLGISLSTVYRHANGMDIKLIVQMRKLDFRTEDMIVYMKIIGGQSISSIARALGVSISYVSETLNG